MASKKSYDERLAELQKKQDELKAQAKALKAKASAEERKARTKRLIEIGGAVEMVLKESIGEKAGMLQDGDNESLIYFLRGQEKNGKYFSNAINNGRLKRAAEQNNENK